MCEMWKRKQTHEDARKMYRTNIPDKKLGKMVKTTVGRPCKLEPKNLATC